MYVAAGRGGDQSGCMDFVVAATHFSKKYWADARDCCEGWGPTAGKQDHWYVVAVEHFTGSTGSPSEMCGAAEGVDPEGASRLWDREAARRSLKVSAVLMAYMYLHPPCGQANSAAPGFPATTAPLTPAPLTLPLSPCLHNPFPFFSTLPLSVCFTPAAEQTLLLKCVRVGTYHPTIAGPGCYAMKPEDYDKLRQFFAPLVADVQG